MKLCVFYTILAFVLLFKSGFAGIGITIDAQKDIFYSQLYSPQDGYLTISHAEYLPFCGPKPADDDDLSAKVWMAWDSSYFYLYAEVRDDIIRVNNLARPNNDCMELKFDPDPTLKPLREL